MKKRIILSLIVLASTTGHNLLAQDYNRFSIDAQGGINRILGPVAPGSSLKLANLFSAKAGVRYMATGSFGVRLSYSFDQLKGDYNSREFSTNMHLGSIEAVLNFGRLTSFEDFSKHLGLLLHAGPGIGVMTGQDINNQDVFEKVGHFTFGITPMLRLTEKIALTGDLSMYGTVRQQNTFDFKARTTTTGFDGYFANMSLGISISLGKNDKNVDWTFKEDDSDQFRDSISAELTNLKTENDLLRSRVQKIESDMKDDDKDGVENHIDEEPQSREGAVVDTKGREVSFPEFEDLMEDSVMGQRLFFTVQLGVYSRSIPEKFWRNISPIYVLKIEDGTRRYFTEILHSVNEAQPVMMEARNKGVNDAFITAYYKGKRITVAEAEIILATQGPGVLRDKP